MTANEFKPLIIEWAKEKGLVSSENYPNQYLKLIEECGELASAILKNDIENQKEEIGDIFVVATIMEAQLNNKVSFNWRYREFLGNEIGAIKSIIDNPVDDIGLINNICIDFGFYLNECVEIAWNKIKDRKGVTKNGTFIKD